MTPEDLHKVILEFGENVILELGETVKELLRENERLQQQVRTPDYLAQALEHCRKLLPGFQPDGGFEPGKVMYDWICQDCYAIHRGETPSHESCKPDCYAAEVSRFIDETTRLLYRRSTR